MLYFAYGANLDASQMRLRCAGARGVGKARLDDYRFCFPLWSRIRQSGLISIEPAAGERVWGVLYEVRESDFTGLDLREGFDALRPARNSVSRITVKVARTRGRTSTAETYVARPGIEARMPSADYVAYLAKLAAARGFPEEYQRELRSVRVAALAA
jgi:AIG2 family protein